MASGTSAWLIATVAGTGAQDYSGDGGPAARALLNNPFDPHVSPHFTPGQALE